MPTYQYRCTSCGDELEVVQKFTDPALTQCPACAGSLRKVFNAVGVVFKGSGFYRTDSRAGNGQSGRESAESGSGERGGDAATKPAAAKDGQGDKGAKVSKDAKGSDSPGASGGGSSNSSSDRSSGSTPSKVAADRSGR